MSKNAAMLITLSFFIISCEFLAHPVLSSNDSSESPWVSKTPMPMAGAGFKAGVVNDKIYVIRLNVTYEYNLYSWSTKKPMPTPRYDFATTAYQDKIYCIGGKTNSIPSGTNEVYDPATDSWATKAPIPNAASYYASAVVNNKIYIISEAYTQIYDPETDNWSYGAASPFSVDMAGGATIVGVTPQRVYVIGGRNSGLEVAYTQVYDPENDSWSMGALMPTARYGLAVAVVNDKIYAIGGLTGSFVTVVQNDRNEQYNPVEDTAILSAPSTSPSLPQDTSTPEPEQDPFPTIPVAAASVATIAVVGVGLLVYFKKRNR